jgi:hypothetical protein
VPGVTLRFTSADRGISINSSAVTNSQGLVSILPRAGMRAGEFTLQIASPGLAGTSVRLRVE